MQRPHIDETQKGMETVVVMFSELSLTNRAGLSYCPDTSLIRRAGSEEREARVRGSQAYGLAFVVSRTGFFRFRLERRLLRMGTKPMVFPMDGSGRIYALYDENDEQICTGSRETCYRLLELMLRTKKPAIDVQPQAAEQPERAFQAAGGGHLK